MIPAGVVKSYLRRPLDSHLWVKQLTAQQLDTALKQLNPPPKLNPELRLHQRACFLLGTAHPRMCFWLDMGVGKTVLSLELLRYWWQCDTIRRAIIFVTSDKAFDTWEKQFKRFNIDLPVTALAGSSKEKWQQLEEFGDGLVLLPYPGATAMCSQRVKAKGGRSKKMKWALDPLLVKKLSHWAQAIVLDESTKVGTTTSLVHKLVAQLRKTAKVRYALAGRPFGRDPTMLWAQHYLIDDGETLGETLGLFRAAFFSEKDSYWGGPYSKEYTFKTKMQPQLARMIQHRSITYAADECIDLPKVVPIKEVVSFPEEAQQYYQRVVQEIIAAEGNLREMKNAFLRLRQISSGFIGLRDDTTGEKVEIEFAENPKLERLLELIEEVPEGRGVAVFYEFTNSARRVIAALKELKYKPAWLWSGTEDTKTELARFAKSERPVILVNNKLGSMAIDGLQETANYLMFFESAVGLIDREQAERRLVRQGQKHPTFIYDLVVKNTADEKILAYHKQGMSLFDALLRDPEKALFNAPV